MEGAPRACPGVPAALPRFREERSAIFASMTRLPSSPSVTCPGSCTTWSLPCWPSARRHIEPARTLLAGIPRHGTTRIVLAARSAVLGGCWLVSEHRLRPQIGAETRRSGCCVAGQQGRSPAALPSLVTPGDYPGRLTAAAELRPDAARAVASAVAGAVFTWSPQADAYAGSWSKFANRAQSSAGAARSGARQRRLR